MSDPTRKEFEAMGGFPRCPFCGGVHATKNAALACSDRRRKSFAELDALVAKISNPKGAQ